MRRPLTIKTHAGKQKIVWESNSAEIEDNERGVYLPEKAQIHIAPGYSKADEAVTLLHEALHVLIAEARDGGAKLPLRHEEAYVEALAPRVCRLLIDNPCLISLVKERLS